MGHIVFSINEEKKNSTAIGCVRRERIKTVKSADQDEIMCKCKSIFIVLNKNTIIH